MGERVKNTWKNRPSVIFLVIIFILLVFLLLIALLVRSGIFSGGIGGDGVPPVGEAASPTAGLTEVGAEPTTTPTATRVVQEGETTEGTAAEATATSTPVPASAATPTATSSQTIASPTPGSNSAAPQIANLLRNGGFEQGMDGEGVGLNWHSFHNGGATYIFTSEGWPGAIRNGDYAQRIGVLDAGQADRYAGIYQTVSVVPGATYLLTLQGQIRSGFGDVSQSDYGYRMQYAIDETGGTDWRSISSEDWIEMPWDEQLINGSNLSHLKYETTFMPATRRVTVFIRAWVKWPFIGESQFTLDGLSLVGPVPR